MRAIMLWVAVTRVLAVVLVGAAAVGCSQNRETTPNENPSEGWITLGGCGAASGMADAEVRVHRTRRAVEFDAAVSPILIVDPRSPLVFLEVLCCIANTREHETLLVTKATPSVVHAALLLAGLEPGRAGGFERSPEGRLVAIKPTGTPVRVEYVYVDSASGQSVAVDPRVWIKNARSDEPFGVGGRFVFAGSRMLADSRASGGSERPSRYAADLGGNVVGLSTFGDEVIALEQVMSPEAAVEAPEWVVDFSRLPPANTPVRVRITAAE
jgi:hypothetical protein